MESLDLVESTSKPTLRTINTTSTLEYSSELVGFINRKASSSADVAMGEWEPLPSPGRYVHVAMPDIGNVTKQAFIDWYRGLEVRMDGNWKIHLKDYPRFPSHHPED